MWLCRRLKFWIFTYVLCNHIVWSCRRYLGKRRSYLITHNNSSDLGLLRTGIWHGVFKKRCLWIPCCPPTPPYCSRLRVELFNFRLFTSVSTLVAISLPRSCCCAAGETCMSRQQLDLHAALSLAEKVLCSDTLQDAHGFQMLVSEARKHRAPRQPQTLASQWHCFFM